MTDKIQHKPANKKPVKKMDGATRMANVNKEILRLIKQFSKSGMTDAKLGKLVRAALS